MVQKWFKSYREDPNGQFKSTGQMRPGKYGQF